MQSFELSSLGRPQFWQLAAALIGMLAFYVAGPGLFVLVGTRRPLLDEGVETSFQVGFAMLLSSGLVLGFTAVGPRLAMDQATDSNRNQMARDRMVQKLRVIGEAGRISTMCFPTLFLAVEVASERLPAQISRRIGLQS